MAAQTRDLTALVETVSHSRQIALVAESSAPASRVDLYLKGSHAMVWVKALPALKPGETYQGWWIVKGQPVSAGTFAAGPHFLPAKPGSASAFAITIEPHGGTKAPTTPVLALAPLSIS
jgi:anti-sigma-K factor RskA